MSGVENKLHEAFDALSLPEDVAASTLARIEAARAEEGSALVDPSLPGRKARRPLFARRSFRIAVAACLCGALVFGGGTVVYASESASVEISADAVVGVVADDASAEGRAASVEAAIELGVNRFNIVVRATALNEAGEELLGTIDVVGKSYEDVAALIMGQDAIGQDGFVSVTVSGGNAGQCDYLDQASETCLSHRAEESYVCESVSVEERQAAQDAGMGTARYKAFLELTELDSGVTEELCHDLTLNEMRWMIEALQSGEASTAQEALDQVQAAGVGSGHHAEGTGAGSGSGQGGGVGSGQGGSSGNGFGNGAGAGQGSGSSNGAGASGEAGNANGSGSGQGGGAGGHGAGHGRGAA